MQTSPGSIIEGFWLPRNLREKLLTPDTEFVACSFVGGRPCEAQVEGAITVRWPRMTEAQWKILLTSLEENRRLAPLGLEYWDRLQVALKEAGQRLAETDDSLHDLALRALPGYTGYSEPMVRLTVGALDMFSLEQFPLAFSLSPDTNAAKDWQAMNGLPGRLRFFPLRRKRAGVIRRLYQWQMAPSITRRPLFRQVVSTDVVLGYAAGNIPGAALLIAFLAQSITLAGGRVPAVIVKNSRSEPIFSPLVFNALEAVDPELVSTVAMLVWDYEDTYVQSFLTSHADLVIAAASDETIVQIKAQIEASKAAQVRPRSRPVRFHAHGHKVSFTAIGKEMLSVHAGSPEKPKDAGGLVGLEQGQSMLDIVVLLAALDSIFWDQHGCLSSRIHFVENGGEGYHTPLDYAKKLQEKLRWLAGLLPRGAWPLQQLHDRFDRYKQLEMRGNIQVISRYDDESLVILDQRHLRSSAFRSLVNDCQGRVIVVRPVAELMEVPNQYLKMLPSENLQSMSVAVGKPEEGLTNSILDFAEACGACGITAIRTIGRGAFPQLAYSWDGYLPLDLMRQRPAGHFTTIEFDHPYEQILETIRILPVWKSNRES